MKHFNALVNNLKLLIVNLKTISASLPGNLLTLKQPKQVPNSPKLKFKKKTVITFNTKSIKKIFDFILKSWQRLLNLRTVTPLTITEVA